MAQDMKVLVMHDNQEVLRDITVILGFLGEDVISAPLSDWGSTVKSSIADPSQLNVIILGANNGQIGPLIEELHEWDEGVPCLAIGDVDLDGLDDILRRKVIAQLELPLKMNEPI